jgi:hypothetical protein
MAVARPAPGGNADRAGISQLGRKMRDGKSWTGQAQVFIALASSAAVWRPAATSENKSSSVEHQNT